MAPVYPVKVFGASSGSVRHNVAAHTDESATKLFFQGEIIPGGTSIDYEFGAPDRGDYFFRCDVHPGMNGAVAC